MNQLMKTVGHTIFTHRSAIFMGAGIVLGIGCVAATVVQTIKACDIIDEANQKMDEVDVSVEIEENKEKQLKVIRKETNLALAKNYIVPATLGMASLICILGAYSIISKEKSAALAALSATTAAFEKYRSRVIDKYGAEADYELYNGIKTEKIVTEDGKKVNLTTSNPINSDCYTKVYSYETSCEWVCNRKLNIENLKFRQRYWNDQLRHKGYVTYNEVIESLGFSRKVGDDMTEAFVPNGIGWVSSENIPDNLKDQYDDFIEFVPSDCDGDDHIVYEDAYILRFNCYPIDNLLQKKAKSVSKGH